MFHEDRLNGELVTPQKTEEFQACVDDIGVEQLLKIGRYFTWCNKRDGVNIIYSHIDWAFGNATWMINYENI